jgi:hypothetical protein
MCRVKGPVHDALLESRLVDLVGPEHFYDSVKAAKKGRMPDGLPVVLDWAKPADEETRTPPT